MLKKNLLKGGTCTEFILNKLNFINQTYTLQLQPINVPCTLDKVDIDR